VLPFYLAFFILTYFSKNPKRVLFFFKNFEKIQKIFGLFLEKLKKPKRFYFDKIFGKSKKSFVFFLHRIWMDI